MVWCTAICHGLVSVLQCHTWPALKFTLSIDAEFLTISILNFTFVNINTPSAVIPEPCRTLTMIRPVRIDTFATRAELIIFFTLVHVQAFVHFWAKFHSRRTFTAVIGDPRTALSWYGPYSRFFSLSGGRTGSGSWIPGCNKLQELQCEQLYWAQL